MQIDYFIDIWGISSLAGLHKRRSL